MTLDESIKHCEEVATELEEEAVKYCCDDTEIMNKYYEYVDEYRQLAEWLRELKMWRAYGRRNKDKLPEDMQLLKALNEEVNADENSD